MAYGFVAAYNREIKLPEAQGDARSTFPGKADMCELVAMSGYWPIAEIG